jgi:predicted porin
LNGAATAGNTDNFMTGRTNGVATYRNSDFFGLVDGLSFALQYQGKNDRDDAYANGDGFSTSVTYDSKVSRCRRLRQQPYRRSES